MTLDLSAWHTVGIVNENVTILKLDPRQFMKAFARLLCGALCFLTAQVSHAVVGFVNFDFAPGDTLFANPLDGAFGNQLSALFPSTLANGTTVSLWDSTTASYNAVSTFNAGAWSSDLTLNPGTGALFHSPVGASTFTNTFVGTVLNHDGGTSITDPLPPPSLFSGPSGIYLLSDKAPVANTGGNIFLNILGRLPNIGEQVITLNSTHTYLGTSGINENWSGGTPTLGIAQSAFLNVGPAAVPEPSTVTLGLLGLVLLHTSRRRR